MKKFLIGSIIAIIIVGCVLAFINYNNIISLFYPTKETSVKSNSGQACKFQRATKGNVSYPVLVEHPDKHIMSEINKKIEKVFLTEKNNDVSYTLNTNKQLIIIEKTTVINASAEYPQIQHHFYHIDLYTAKTYTFDDLIKDKDYFKKVLNNLVNSKVMSGQLNAMLANSTEQLPNDTSFQITQSFLKILLKGGSIEEGNYVEDYLNIPYGELENALKKDGVFWTAFDKKIESKANLLKLAEEAVNGYITNFDDAVNSYDFKHIKPYMYKDTNPNSFYSIQEKLLEQYKELNIKEELLDHKILGIVDSKNGLVDYKFVAYCEENIKITVNKSRTEKFNYAYTLEYVAKDNKFYLSDINKWDPKVQNIQAEEDVTVKDTPKPGVSNSSSNKVIRLTFDDGPNGQVTTKILDTLKQYNYKATFFMLSPNMNSNVSILKRMKNEGHTLALHGATHEYNELYKNRDAEAVANSMIKAKNVLEKLMGFKSYICRVPYGTCSGMTAEQLERVKSQGFRVWDWNIDSEDTAKNTSSQHVVDHCIDMLKRIKGECILLMHDKTITMNALPQILDCIKQNNWTVDTISPDVVGKDFLDKNIN